jgi:hypothetical protein
MSIGTRTAHADDLKSYFLVSVYYIFSTVLNININIKIGFHERTKLP